MKKILLPVLIIALYACGSNEAPVDSAAADSNKVTAEALLDSAMNMSYDPELIGDKSVAISLFDEAIEMDKGLKAAYIGKIGLLAKMGDDQMLLKGLEDAQSTFPTDAYFALHLGMEYELQNQKSKADPLYVSALESFEANLDTMAERSTLTRNSLLMNMAMANNLATEKLTEARIENILSENENENFKTVKAQFAQMDRDELLNLRRK